LSQQPESREPSRVAGQPRTRKGERGQSLVEFAIAAPLIILLFLVLVELGSALNSYLTVLAAARDGARLGAQGDVVDTDIVTLITNETARLSSTVPTACNGSSAGVCITHGTTSSVNSIRVQVCYDHPVMVGIPVLAPGPIRICSQTTMRVAT
jgi:Flp pilus assembly protein TadG